MLRLRFFMWTLPVLFLGCSDADLTRIDAFVGDVNAVAQTAADLPESPAGVLIPPSVRVALELIGLTGAAAVAVWQRIRASRLLDANRGQELTGRAVVAAIERLDADAKAEVTPNVKAELRRLCYETGGRDQINAWKGGA